MTIQAQVSVYAQVFVPRDYDVFAGLDVDHHSIAATFTDHRRLMQSLRLPYSAGQLLNYVKKHFPGQRLVFVYEAGPTGFGLYDELVAAGHPCLVVAPPQVPRAARERVKTNRLDSRKLSTALRGGVRGASLRFIQAALSNQMRRDPTIELTRRREFNQASPDESG